MRSVITAEQRERYDRDGVVVIEDFLDATELSTWRATLDGALERRGAARFGAATIDPGASDEPDVEADAEAETFYDNVFDQRVNLWQTDAAMRSLILDERLGRMAADLSGSDGIRVWHDQALVKRPYANPTAFHLDVPYWSFSSRNALSIWIALDDATEENGCLYFFSGSHLETTYDNVGIGPNVGAIFEVYPQFATREATSGAMRAGSCSFHNGLMIHGAGANMTNGSRRAMTCAYMPDGSVFNGQRNILPKEYVDGLSIGDPIDDDDHVPLIFRR